MKILFEDESIAVVEKEAGIPVQTKDVSGKSLETELKKHRKKNKEIPEIYVVHRLDQPVSGIILFAKTKEAAATLTKGIVEDEFVKDYKAVVYGKGEIATKGTLINYLVKDAKTNSSSVCSKEVKNAKEAILDYEVIEEGELTKTLLVHLKTGRHHQIRVQLAHLGFPIVGDTKYGTPDSIQYSKEQKVKGVCLTAYHLEFVHPKTKEKLIFDI